MVCYDEYGYGMTQVVYNRKLTLTSAIWAADMLGLVLYGKQSIKQL